MDRNSEKIIIEGDADNLDERKETKKTVRVLSFRLGEENYAVNIADAKEVVKPGPITRVPNTPDFVVGVMNLRGEIISIIDLRYFFGLSGKQLGKETSIITTDITGALIGIMVHEIKEALDIDEEAIQPPLGTIKGEVAEYTKGQIKLNKNILILLDLKKILNSQEIERIRKGS